MRAAINALQNKYSASYFSDNELFTKYLSNSTFRGFYYDAENKSYGLSIHFSAGRDNELIISAIESQCGISISQYEIVSKSYSIESMAYDKVLISVRNYKIVHGIRMKADADIQLPAIVEFVLLLLSRDSMFIYFPNPELYASPIKSIKGGLVLSREKEDQSDFIEKEQKKTESFFHV